MTRSTFKAKDSRPRNDEGLILADIGSVSSGTMGTEDLIETFLGTLHDLDSPNHADLLQEWENMSASDIQTYEEANSDFLNETLFDALQEHAPPYCYFGAHPGDGADFGFWVSEGIQDTDCDDLAIVEDLPSYALEINDHGNMTLYRVTREEVWSCV